MPDWLLNDEEIVTKKSKDAFINKSILALLHVLSRIRRGGNKNGKGKFSAAAAIFSLIFFILLISLSRSLFFITTAGVMVLLLLSLMKPYHIAYILKASFMAAFFAMFILLPSFFSGNRSNSILMILKILESVALVSMTTCTVSAIEAKEVLKLMFLPDIFIFVFEISIKYIVILGEFSLDMLYALKLRTVGSSGNNKDSRKALGGIIGTLFIKSKEMSEEMCEAMECRGFTGEYSRQKNYRFNYWDLLILCVDVIFLVIYILC